MNKNLGLIEKNARLSCVWVATGDARMPLVRKWVELIPEKARHPKQEQPSAAKARANLVGLMCWLTPVPITGIAFSAAHETLRPACGENFEKESDGMRRCA
jgi:hypothetical protein